jgi:hypothetical protein
MDNPFSGYGQVLPPDRFIGRKHEIATLRQRVLSVRGASVAIVGEARIGKTSLMRFVFNQSAPEVNQVKGIVVEINVGTFARPDPKIFFTDIVYRTHRALKKQSASDAELLKEIYEKIKVCDESELFRLLQDYFGDLADIGYRVILLLDEFEGISNVFGENEAAFQSLRELGNDHRLNVSIVTTSRITLGTIEVTSLISTLAGIFADVHVGLMSDAEIKQLLDTRISNSTITFTNLEREYLINYAGFYPFFIEMAAFHLWSYKFSYDGKDLTDVEIETVLDSIRSEAYEKFDNFRTRMSDKRFRTLLAVTQGPRVYATSPFEMHRLLQQGHIRRISRRSNAENDSYSYKPFSILYDEYLRSHVTQVDLWPLWSKTEKGLRRLIEERYSRVSQSARLPLDQYLKVNHPHLHDKYKYYIREKRRNDRFFTLTSHPFDFTAPSDLWEFVHSEWNEFSDVFGPRSAERQAIWKQKFEELRDARNPYAHNNHDMLSEVVKKKAEAICLEICELLERANTSNT